MNYADLYTKATEAFDLGRPEDAIPFYNAALEANPKGYEAWYDRGNAFYELGMYPDAIASYDQALKVKPDLYEAWHNMGNAFYELGDIEAPRGPYRSHQNTELRHSYYKKALASYRKAIKIKPDKYEAWHNRGNVLRDLGKAAQASIAYDKAQELRNKIA